MLGALIQYLEHCIQHCVSTKCEFPIPLYAGHINVEVTTNQPLIQLQGWALKWVTRTTAKTVSCITNIRTCNNVLGYDNTDMCKVIIHVCNQVLWHTDFAAILSSHGNRCFCTRRHVFWFVNANKHIILKNVMLMFELRTLYHCLLLYRWKITRAFT